MNYYTFYNVIKNKWIAVCEMTDLGAIDDLDKHFGCEDHGYILQYNVYKSFYAAKREIPEITLV